MGSEGTDPQDKDSEPAGSEGKEKERSDIEDKFNVLVVDDELDILVSLSWVFRKIEELRINVNTASNGGEALEELEDKEFDLIMADYKMPGMNGIELLEKVKDMYPRTVRILITGYSDVNIAKDAINRAAVHHYVGKPWDNDDLRLTVRTILERKRERETSQIKVVKKMNDAVKLLKRYKKEMTSLPADHISKELIMLQFDDVTEFNKFAYAVRDVRNALIRDVQIFEDKHIVSLVVKPEKYAFVPKMDRGPVI